MSEQRAEVMNELGGCFECGGTDVEAFIAQLKLRWSGYDGGYRQALRDVLEDAEAMRIPDPDNAGYWSMVSPEEMIAKIKARLASRTS